MVNDDDWILIEKSGLFSDQSGKPPHARQYVLIDSSILNQTTTNVANTRKFQGAQTRVEMFDSEGAIFKSVKHMNN